MLFIDKTKNNLSEDVRINKYINMLDSAFPRLKNLELKKDPFNGYLAFFGIDEYLTCFNVIIQSFDLENGYEDFFENLKIFLEGREKDTYKKMEAGFLCLKFIPELTKHIIGIEKNRKNQEKAIEENRKQKEIDDDLKKKEEDDDLKKK